MFHLDKLRFPVILHLMCSWRPALGLSKNCEEVDAGGNVMLIPCPPPDPFYCGLDEKGTAKGCIDAAECGTPPPTATDVSCVFKYGFLQCCCDGDICNKDLKKTKPMLCKNDVFKKHAKPGFCPPPGKGGSSVGSSFMASITTTIVLTAVGTNLICGILQS